MTVNDYLNILVDMHIRTFLSKKNKKKKKMEIDKYTKKQELLANKDNGLESEHRFN